MRTENRDKSSMNAVLMLSKLEKRERAKTGLTLEQLRPELARKIGVPPGTIENIRRGRVKDLKQRVVEKIRNAFIREMEKEILALNHEIELARQGGLDPTGEQVSEIEATLAKLKELMGKQ